MKFIDHMYDTKKKMHWYHIGGALVGSESYRNFYQWKSTKKLHYDHDDMPHDYFVFLNDEDRLEMHVRFKQYIMPKQRAKAWVEGWRDCTTPVDKNSLEYMLGEILMEEINKEIIKEIAKNAI
jgi:hypothetical protein